MWVINMFKAMMLICVLLIGGCSSMGEPRNSCGQGYKIPGCDPANPYSTPTKSN